MRQSKNYELLIKRGSSQIHSNDPHTTGYLKYWMLKTVGTHLKMVPDFSKFSIL